MDTIGVEGGDASEAADLDGRREADDLRAGAGAWGIGQPGGAAL